MHRHCLWHFRSGDAYRFQNGFDRMFFAKGDGRRGIPLENAISIVEAVVTDRCGEVGPLFYPGGVQCHWTTIANGRATGSKKQLY